jgi:hypothetical protein
MRERGFGPNDREALATVDRASDALEALGCAVEPVVILEPIIGRAIRGAAPRFSATPRYHGTVVAGPSQGKG